MKELNPLEKKVFENIDFVNRFYRAQINMTEDRNIHFSLKSKGILKILNSFGYNFEAKKNIFIHNETIDGYTFRLLFDIKGKSCLTYIYILKDGLFIDNGLSHFGYLLNFFDISNLSFNLHFGINSEEDLKIYIEAMLGIYNDFKDEYLKQLYILGIA